MKSRLGLERFGMTPSCHGIRDGGKPCGNHKDPLPNDDERKAAGIYNTLLHGGAPVRDPRTGVDIQANDYHQISEGKRENHWLDKIEKWCKEKSVSDETVISGGIVVPTPKTIILVCGHNHLPFVGSKISVRGHSVVQLEYLPYNKEDAQGLFTVFND
jgi:hypothetical protein